MEKIDRDINVDSRQFLHSKFTNTSLSGLFYCFCEITNILLTSINPALTLPGVLKNKISTLMTKMHVDVRIFGLGDRPLFLKHSYFCCIFEHLIYRLIAYHKVCYIELLQ
jgi:hypothetical protein